MDFFLEGGQVLEEGDVFGLSLEQNTNDCQRLVARGSMDQVQLGIYSFRLLELFPSIHARFKKHI